MFSLLLLLITLPEIYAQSIKDCRGKYIGRVASSRYYDGSERYIGRISGKRLFDGSGRNAARRINSLITSV
ncbi:MAG: hypothetical protein EA394_00150 [Bacteroidia bacterium]|nr:MAG: hypothetical protein EA394_00150 [Bacteroidia bacterium]